MTLGMAVFQVKFEPRPLPWIVGNFHLIFFRLTDGDHYVERYREEEGCVNERLRRAGSKISVTLDCWTSPNNEAFLGITGHYIDNEWALQSLVLDFVPLNGEHTGENLCGAFVGACE